MMIRSDRNSRYLLDKDVIDGAVEDARERNQALTAGHPLHQLVRTVPAVFFMRFLKPRLGWGGGGK